MDSIEVGDLVGIYDTDVDPETDELVRQFLCETTITEINEGPFGKQYWFMSDMHPFGDDVGLLPFMAFENEISLIRKGSAQV